MPIFACFYENDTMTKHFFRTELAGLLTVAALAGCGKTPDPEPDPTPQPDNRISLTPLSQMTLKEKVGQLFTIPPEDLVPGASGYLTQGSATMKETFKDYPCGGIILFAGNIKNPSQIKEFNSFLHDLGNYPIICVDEEGGRVARIAKNSNFNVPTYKSMEEVGKTGDPQNAYNAGDRIGTYLLNYSFDIDFAPVSDVNTNPDNVVIGDRAFGSDPQLVANMASQFLKGLLNNKVEGCLKHFPGHGDTSTDSHYGYAESLKTWDQLVNCEMIPFKKGIESGARMIMTAHICLPSVAGAQMPSTLSSTILQDKLRGELGYKGVIITDSMGMGAITKEYSAGEAAVLAIEAGVDMMLMPENYKEAFQAVLDAVASGRLTEKMIDERATRVLELKKSLLRSRGLLKE